MKRLKTFLRWIVFLGAAFVLNFPVITTLVTSVKTGAEISANPTLTIAHPTLENYAKLLGAAGDNNIWDFLGNSIVAALIGTVLPLVVCFPAAYAIARRGQGRRVLFPLVVNLRALPLIVFAIPLYLMYQGAGLLDTRLGLGLILAVVNLPLTLLIFVNAIKALPLEIEEAARMDGARLGRLLRKVVLPLCRPAIATAFVFGFITAWNEFLFGLMLTTRDALPVTVGASLFFSSTGGGVNWGMAAAVIIVSSLPPVVFGMLMYRHIGGSVVGGAVKG